MITYRNTFQAARLGLAGNPYLLDNATMIETSALGIRLTPETLALIRACAIDIWLIPKGEKPFAMTGFYGNRVFDDTFRQAFMETYRKGSSLRFFDLWECGAADPAK